MELRDRRGTLQHSLAEVVKGLHITLLKRSIIPLYAPDASWGVFTHLNTSGPGWLRTLRAVKCEGGAEACRDTRMGGPGGGRVTGEVFNRRRGRA